MASRATTDPIEILLEMGVDLDNLSEEEDYLSALMEGVNTLTIKDASDPRIGSLADEIRKVRKKRKAADPTFKVKKSKISANSFKEKTPKVSATQKALPGTGKGGALAVRKTKVDPGALVKSGGEEQGQNILEKILASVNSILGTLKQDQKNKKKTADQERRKGERSKRKGKEDKLESGIFKGLVKGVQKVLKPVEGLLSRILKFIGTILIGKILQKIVGWMGDPQNKEKLDAIGNFLKVTWPAILGAFLIFSTGLGGIITGLIALVAKFLPKIIKTIARLAAINPLATIAVVGGAAALGGAYVASRMNESNRNKENEEDDESTVTPAETKETGETPSGSQLQREQILQRGMGMAFSGGGKVPGSGNKDTVPAMLTPGEYVMSKGAVQKYGKGTMESMNAMGGGSGIPSFSNGMMYASSGGEVSTNKEPGGRNKHEHEEESSDGGFLGGVAKALGFGKSKDKKDKKETEVSSSGGGFNESSLKAAMDKAGYTDPTERAMFLAQMAHESGNFRYDEEIHDGSNYEGRSDLGNTQPGDGKRYKGRGYIQLTGRANYTHYGSKLGVDLAGKPELAKRPDIAADVAVAYWNERVDRAAAAKGDVRTVTRNINGGYNGLQDRIDKFKKYSGNPNYTAPGGGPIASSSGGGGSSSASSSSGGGSGGGAFGGLLALAKMQKIATGSSSSSSSGSAGSSGSLGSKPSPPSPPAPPTKAAPKVSVMNSGESGGSSSGQQTPVSEAASKVPLVPSAINSKEKMAVLGIS